MRLKQIYAAVLFPLLPAFVTAQAIDNTSAIRNIDSDKYFRIFYENDFFGGTDRDYTQGIYIEKVHPSFRKFLLSKLLVHPLGGQIKYGIALENEDYTPDDYGASSIQFGDHPFCGALFLKTFLTWSDKERHDRLTTELSTGIIGPGAGGEAMQKAIHSVIHDTEPQGWHNQIKTDAVLNYQLNYEHELLYLKNLLSFSSYASVRIGTLSDEASGGFTLMIGDFYSPFRPKPPTSHKWIQFYVYEQLLANAIGYDATLQGGLFNRSSAYIIEGSDLDRLTVYNKFGAVVTLHSFYIEYYQTGMTQEFMTSLYHRTGGIQVGFGF